MDIAGLYQGAQRSFVDLIGDLDDEQWATPSPCTPGWTVRDVLSHAAGVAIDLVDGNMEGAPGEVWTAAHVERWRDTPTGELIERWNDAAIPAAEQAAAIGDVRMAFDCWAHEHDVRTALGRHGGRESELLAIMFGGFTRGSVGPAVIIEPTDADPVTMAGAGDPITLRGVARFDVVRSRLGRRSRDQVAAWDWSGPVPDELLDNWFAFGPAIDPIIE